jgi:hypothetical protein
MAPVNAGEEEGRERGRAERQHLAGSIQAKDLVATVVEPFFDTECVTPYFELKALTSRNGYMKPGIRVDSAGREIRI